MDTSPTLAAVASRLTLKQAAFLRALREPDSPTHDKVTASYRSVYNVANASDASVTAQAYRLMATPRVRAVLDVAKTQAAQAVVFDRVDVLRHLVELATADPTKISHVRRICCRRCHGLGHAYQWRDEEEYYQAVAVVMDRNARRAANIRGEQDDRGEPLPTNEGGYGWRRPAKPHPECPECFGEGEEEVYLADMSTLPGPERRLISSVRKTREGVEVKMRDQDGALNTIAQILKMLVNKSEVSGPDGGPIPVAGVLAVLPVDAEQAAQAYQRLMEGNTG